jgi:hypothetical protein
VISIDFVGEDVAMAAGEIAGVVAKPHWNNASNARSSAPLALVDETGAATTASVSWTANGIWELPTSDQPGNARMMKGYLDTGSLTTTAVNVTGLPVRSYQIYVYADGSTSGATRTGVYTISGAGITTTSISLTDLADTDFSGTFTQAENSAGNYVVFTINATAFTISATPGSSTDAYPRATINGIQIVPIADFTLSAAPGSRTVNPGGGTAYTVNVGAVSGFSGAVNLSVSGLPASATGTFGPASISAGASSMLTVATATSTPTGSFPITIAGTSGSLQHSTSATLVVSTSAGSPGNVISIDFLGEDVAMAAGEIAGVVAKPHWNNASNARSSAPLALVDETGAATTASVSWTANGIWELPTSDQPGNARMMKGYLDTGSLTTTAVNVTGLPVRSYQIYVYADGSTSGATRTGAYTISGAGITTTSISLTDLADTDFSGTFKQAENSAGNYAVFSIPSVSGFTITATPGNSTDNYPRAPVNAIQIVPN